MPVELLNMSTSWVYREASKLGLNGYKLGRGRNSKILYKRAEVATYWRTNLASQQVASLFGVSKSAAARALAGQSPAQGHRPPRPTSSEAPWCPNNLRPLSSASVFAFITGGRDAVKPTLTEMTGHTP